MELENPKLYDPKRNYPNLDQSETDADFEHSERYSSEFEHRERDYSQTLADPY